MTHGGIANNVGVDLDWIDSEVFETETEAVRQARRGARHSGAGRVWRSAALDGMIEAARFARERRVPYFGICFGMHMAIIEAARDLADLPGAGSTEFGPCGHPVVGLMTEWMRGNTVERRNSTDDLGGTMRLGAYRGGAGAGQPGGRDLWRRPDQRTPSPPLRGQCRLQADAGSGRAPFFRHVAGRHAAGDRRAPRSSLVHRRAIPSRSSNRNPSSRTRCSPPSSAPRSISPAWFESIRAALGRPPAATCRPVGGTSPLGNDLPLVFIVGPNTLESRAHALEMSAALAEIADKLGIGLIYKTSFDKANRSSVGSEARHRAESGAADPRRSARDHRAAGADRCARARTMRPGGRSRRYPADPGLSLPPDRSAAGGGRDRQADQHQEGPVPGAVGHEERRRQDRLDRQRADPAVRARHELRLQHARRRHARAADHGARPATRSCSTRPMRWRSRAALGDRSGGEREFAPVLARAAAAVGVAAIFIETHQDPDNANPARARRWCR